VYFRRLRSNKGRWTELRFENQGSIFMHSRPLILQNGAKKKGRRGNSEWVSISFGQAYPCGGGVVLCTVLLLELFSPKHSLSPTAEAKTGAPYLFSSHLRVPGPPLVQNVVLLSSS
jgi:hypothetical protein